MNGNIFSRSHRRRVVQAASIVSALALIAGCRGTSTAHGTPTATPPPSGNIAAVADVSSLVDKVKSSVVNITVDHVGKTSASPGTEQGSPFDFFFPEGAGASPRAQKQRALGTGFLIDAHGHVLTNAHVVEGVDKVRVKLADERELDAIVKGRDPKLDIALLEVQGAKNLPYASFGSTAATKVGEAVLAIGNPFGLGHTVTTGIVSAKGRTIGAGPYDDFIQTDASINPGNSGGPLFDMRGQVIGMNTAINPAGQGIGFAIPADEIKQILPQLLSKGRVDRGRIGVQIQEIDQTLASAMGLGTTRGALVGDVEKGGPGEAAGLRTGDVIVGVDGVEIAHAHDLPRNIGRREPGAQVKLDVRRGTSRVVVPVTLAPLDEEKASAQRPSGESAPGAAALGVEVADAEGGGALVRRVSPDGPAAEALRAGDVIIEVNREPVQTASDLASRVSRVRKGASDKPLLLRVKRGDSLRWVAIERAA